MNDPATNATVAGRQAAPATTSGAFVDWGPAYRALGSLSQRTDPDATIQAAKAAIDADPAETLDLDALARIAGYSRFHFIRRFAKLVGETPGRYQTRRRMELARRLLETTQSSVTEICFQVGYASLGSFSDSFAQINGRPPRDWRDRVGALGTLRASVPPVPSCFVSRHATPEQVRNLEEASASVGP